MNDILTEQVLWRSAQPNSAGYRDVGAQEVALLRMATRVIDVREPHELTTLPAIKGAELVPLRTLPMSADGWDRAEPIVVVCRSGGRSAMAAELLASMGFLRVINMRGGMLAYPRNSTDR